MNAPHCERANDVVPVASVMTLPPRLDVRGPLPWSVTHTSARCRRAQSPGQHNIVSHVAQPAVGLVAGLSRQGERPIVGEFLAGHQDADGRPDLAVAGQCSLQVRRAVLSRIHTVVMASSATGRDLKALRKAVSAHEAITVATSSDDGDDSKPSPDILSVDLDRAGVVAGEAVFVGDAAGTSRRPRPEDPVHRSGVWRYQCRAATRGRRG